MATWHIKAMGLCIECAMLPCAMCYVTLTGTVAIAFSTTVSAVTPLSIQAHPGPLPPKLFDRTAN